MSQDDSFVDTQALARLTKIFETYRADFQSPTNEPHGEIAVESDPSMPGIPTEDDQLRYAQVEVANLMMESLNALGRQVDHLDDALNKPQGIPSGKENSTVTDADER
ncbi:hypothetical protein [Streptomyces lydicus]|uniref:hypothetical protein n=1 Tax=Streptomyces lydicus TaxID=47763 RepID=UPI00378FBCF4